MMNSNKLTSYATLVLFILIVMGVGSYIGVNNPPGEWYAALTKPSFNPPNWLFAPVWTALYLMIAVAGWRLFERDRGGVAMKLWLVQLLLNWAWSPVWFGLHLRWPSVGVVLALWIAIFAFIVSARKSDRAASFLFVPYLAWVSFAAILNVSLVVLNPS